MPVRSLYSASLNGTETDIPAPEGDWVALHCDGDVAVSLYQASAYVALETVSAPGKLIFCTGSRIRLVTTGAVNVRLINANGA